MTLVTLEEVTKRYRDGRTRREAVAGVSLALEAGQLWAVRGPSGSGKSTLLGILGAMVQPTSGRVRFGDTDVTSLRDHHRTALRRQTVGFVFQELALIDGVTVMENVLVPLVPLGGARAADRERAQALLTRFGLGDRAGSVPARLSGGEKQRVAIARALILEPKVLLLDEPTAHLDRETAGGVVDLLVELRDEGRAIVAATHDPRLADDERLDRVLDLVDGALR